VPARQGEQMRWSSYSVNSMGRTMNTPGTSGKRRMQSTATSPFGLLAVGSLAVVAEAIIASPSITPESVDAHLIRICTRLLGIIGGAGLLAVGADRLGIPVYGIIAGLGVGGLAIALATRTGRGGGVDFSSSFGAGDVFVEPLWLDWSFKHWDLGLAYGFYAPVGRYDTETMNLPAVGPITVEEEDNIGLGFWTHQVQGAVSWYPWSTGVRPSVRR